MAEITVDGVLDETQWQEAQTIEEFFVPEEKCLEDVLLIMEWYLLGEIL